MTSACILRFNWACRFVYVELRVAMNGVVLKLSAKGSNNSNDSLAMLGSASVIRLTSVDLYDYTLRVFPDLVTELPMHPVIHETSFGATAGFRQFIKDLGPEAVRRHVDAEAEEPDVAAPVSLVAAEEVSADTEVTLACVGLRTDLEGETEPEALEPTITLQASLPAEVQKTVDLGRGHTRVLSLDGVLKELCRPSPLQPARYRSKNSRLLYM